MLESLPTGASHESEAEIEPPTPRNRETSPALSSARPRVAAPAHERSREVALPPPHDPLERSSVHSIGEWEVRVFTGRHFEYFVPRGLWHVQLWHPRRRISILTPSRLTADAWEAFPVREWKARRASFAGIALALAAEHHALVLPDRAEVAWVVATFVTKIERPIAASLS